MKKVNPNWIRTLKSFHIFFVSIWSGSWLCLLLVTTGLNGGNVSQMLNFVQTIHFAVVIPSVIGSLVTGVLFSATTNWGFIKHHWIIIKYVFNIFPILGGAIIFLPRLRAMTDLAKSNPSGALSNPVFITDKNAAVIFLTLEFVFLGVAFYLSTFKPKLGPRRASNGTVNQIIAD